MNKLDETSGLRNAAANSEEAAMFCFQCEQTAACQG